MIYMVTINQLKGIHITQPNNYENKLKSLIIQNS
jgi:hypothetical protein